MRPVKCAVAAAVLLAGVSLVAGDFTPATYTIDLALPPKQRWKAAVKGVVRQQGWDATFGALLGWAHGLPYFETLLSALSPVFDDVLGYLGPYAGEIEVSAGHEAGALHQTPHHAIRCRVCGRPCKRCAPM